MRRPIISILTASLALAGHSLVLADFIPETTGYRDGVERFHAGDYRGAAAAFEKSISLAPEPDADADYLPYLYLAASQYQLGNTCTAELVFSQSQALGEASMTPYAETLAEHYRQHAGAPANAVRMDASQTTSFTRERVLQRCRLANDLAGNDYPWYFHYLLGLKYESSGDIAQALDAYLIGANMLQQPERRKRAYGMHYVDYLPYFRIARSHAQLGDWARAREALNVSRALGEYRPGDPDFEQFAALDAQVAAAQRGGDQASLAPAVSARGATVTP